MIYARGHNTGHLETRIVEPGEAEIVLTGWPGMSRLRMLGVACGVEATLEVAGRRGVSVTFDPTSEGATYRAKWTP
jgi:hypothetical protein